MSNFDQKGHNMTHSAHGIFFKPSVLDSPVNLGIVGEIISECTRPQTADQPAIQLTRHRYLSTKGANLERMETRSNLNITSQCLILSINPELRPIRFHSLMKTCLIAIVYRTP